MGCEVSTVPTVWEDLLSSAALSTDVLPVTPPATTSSETLSTAAQVHHPVSARSPFTSTPRSQARSPSSGTARAPAQAPSKPSNPAEFKIPEKEYSMEEVAKHNKKEDLWVVVKGVVMDVSDWLDEHPGGPQAIMNFMGRDATEE